SRRRHTILVSDWSSDVCSSDLLGRGLDADEEGLLVLARRLDGAIGVEVDAAAGGAGAGGQPLGDGLGLGQGGAVEDGGEHLVEQIGRASCRERGGRWAGGGRVK